MIAQQAIEVYPTAVTHTEKNDWWGVDYSKYVPVLLQELKALRARVATLEGGFAVSRHDPRRQQGGDRRVEVDAGVARVGAW